jgi:hypothetical protein
MATDAPQLLMTANYLTPMTTSDPTPTTTQLPTVPEDLLVPMIEESQVFRYGGELGSGLALGPFDIYSRELARRVVAWAWAQRTPEVEAARQEGADAELEACCQFLNSLGHFGIEENLYRVRRPAPPTLREQALTVLRTAENDGAALTTGDVALIRQALQEPPNA